MSRVILERLSHAVFVVIGVSLLAFLLVHLTGDPAALLLPLDASQEDRDRFRAAMGLDRPLPIQYADFVVRAVQGDFGNSLRFQQPAMGLVVERLPATLALAAVSLGLALLCNRPMVGVTWYRTAYFTPVITNVVAIGLVWSYFYAPNVGILNWFLSLFGVRGPSWLTDVTWAMPAVILVSIWQGVGYPMVILLAGLQGIPESLYEAAKIDGAGSWQRFRHVTLPLLTPAIFFLTITQFISSFQVFGLIFILTHGGPANATNVYIYNLYQNAFQFSKMGYASAMAWILFAIIAAITIVQWKLQKRWVFYE